MADEERKSSDEQRTEKTGILAGGSATSFVETLSGLFVWVVVISAGALATDAGRKLFQEYWYTGSLVLVAIFVFTTLPAINAKLKLATSEARTAATVFVVLPLIFASIVCIILLEESNRSIVMRIVFLAFVVLLPATMYYLFIVTRKDSLLHEYITLLDRLGFLQPGKLKLKCEENLTCRYELLLGPQLRVETYVLRFEAAYGPISEESRKEFISTLLRGLDPRDPCHSDDSRLLPKLTVGFTEVFNLSTAVPVIIATVLIALGWLMILPPTGGAAGGTMLTAFDPDTGPVGFAFLGSYFFGLQAIFRRYVRRDLRASAYVAISIRIVLAVIGIWVVVKCAGFIPEIYPGAKPISNESLAIVGFVLGVFPNIAWQFVKKVMSKLTFAQFVIPSLSSQLPLSDLDGLTVWHESRLEDEDIENFANMATADLSDLMLNTRIARARIIDWVDQAMLYVQLGPKNGENSHAARDTLRSHGIRNATSLLVAYDRSLMRRDCGDFEAVLDSGEIATRRRIRSLVDAIVTSPNLDPVLTWKGITRVKSVSHRIVVEPRVAPKSPEPDHFNDLSNSGIAVRPLVTPP